MPRRVDESEESDEVPPADKQNDSVDEQSSEDSEDVQFDCCLCHEEIDDNHLYLCDQCNENYCPDCYIAIEGRKRCRHKLQKLPIAERGYEVYRYKTSDGKDVIVGNYVHALPGSRFLKRNNVQSVLSIIQFPNANKQTEPLRIMFKRQTSYLTTPDPSGNVMYHHISIPDVAFPGILKEWDAEDFFERCSTFISERLAHGNVYVHCEKGQRRSPTAVMAWMVTQGLSSEDALSTVGKDYQNDDSWQQGYAATRPKWVEELKKWAATWNARSNAWRTKNTETVKLWGSPVSALPQLRETPPTPDDVSEIPPSNPSRVTIKPKTSPIKTTKRRRVLDDEDDDELPTPAEETKKRPREPEPLNPPITDQDTKQVNVNSASDPVGEIPPPAKKSKPAEPGKPKGKGLLAFFAPKK